MKQKFFRCAHCGNIIAMVEESGVPVMCCGQKMEEIIPNTTDGATEKHVPVIFQDDNIVTVKVSTVEHPMSIDHHISWISIETKKGNQRKVLSPGQIAWAEFAVVDGDQVLAAYAYCNLHGLWKSEEVR